MVSALTHVVAGAPMGSAPAQRPMHGASGYYAHEMGSYRGAPSPELAGTQALTNQPGQTRLLPTTSFPRARARSLARSCRVSLLYRQAFARFPFFCALLLLPTRF